MTRAAKVCSSPGCPNLQPCAEHEPKPWATSKRSEHSTLSGGRRQQRARYILRRDNTVCHICGYPGADQADHVVPLAQGGADTAANMAAVHAEPCHREKTSEESIRARA